MSKRERFRAVNESLPETYLSWDLFGKGLDCLGHDRKPVELPLREPGEDEILLRVDAIGLCFSDTKLIWAGNEHPRIRGRDLEADPTVPGHEASLTVVKVGEKWKDRFRIGERYTIQADIYIDGEQKAFGYVQRGALAQFVYAGPWILDGDDGCYLLPVKDSTGYAEAALVEPWTCVEAAYSIPQREALKAGGALLLVAAGESEADFTDAYAGDGPAVVVELGGVRLAGLGSDPVAGGASTPDAVAAAAAKHAGGKGFDDIVILGSPDAFLLEAADKALAPSGILCMLGQGVQARIDIGRVHYHDTRHVGADAGPVREAYANNTRKDIRPGGFAWLIGAAGPMGQMHVQRTLELSEPPAKVLCTDVSDERLAYMENRLRPIAEKRGVEMLCLNPMNESDFDARARDFSPDGYDDIVVLAPIAKLVEHAAGFVADGAVVNIFAGVALGTGAALPLETVTEKHVRYIGSSGSPLEAMKRTLQKTEAGELSPNYSLAAVGDVYQAWEGIKGVKEGTFPGKIVIYPHLRNVPLEQPEALEKTCVSAAGALDDGGFWSNAAEAALFEEKL